MKRTRVILVSFVLALLLTLALSTVASAGNHGHRHCNADEGLRNAVSHADINALYGLKNAYRHACL